MKAFKFLNVIVIFALLLAAVPGMVADAAAAITVSPGYEGTADEQVAVRYRNFFGNAANHQVYLGVPNLGNVGNRTQRFVNPWPATNHIKFEWKPADAKLYQTVTNANPGSPYPLTYPSGTTLLPNPGTLNYIKILVQANATGTTVSLNNVTVNGTPVGSFVAPPQPPAAANGTSRTLQATCR